MTRHDDDRPTVTIFADRGELVARIADEICARGASTHTISVQTGWVRSASRTLLVLDSAVGMTALRDLCESDEPAGRVVAMLPDGAAAEAEQWCDRCSERHDVVMVRGDGPAAVEQAADEVLGPQA